jgi:hypothetical protein
MTIVRFPWNPTLVDVRREVCPSARFEKGRRQWIMNEADANRFLQAAHSRLEYTKCQARVMVDDHMWVIGFVQGAPFRATAASTA